jgi:hypothetical protein
MPDSYIWFRVIADIATALFAAIVFAGIIGRIAIATWFELVTAYQKRKRD